MIDKKRIPHNYIIMLERAFKLNVLSRMERGVIWSIRKRFRQKGLNTMVARKEREILVRLNTRFCEANNTFEHRY